jgi:hypothetical protein
LDEFRNRKCIWNHNCNYCDFFDSLYSAFTCTFNFPSAFSFTFRDVYMWTQTSKLAAKMDFQVWSFSLCDHSTITIVLLRTSIQFDISNITRIEEMQNGVPVRSMMEKKMEKDEEVMK